MKELHGLIDVFVDVVLVKYEDCLNKCQSLEYESTWKCFWGYVVGQMRSTRAYLILHTVEIPNIFGPQSPPV